MEEKTQVVKEETSGIVVLDPGIAVIDEDIRAACCPVTFMPIR
jgi:hypothetical protein